MNPKITPQWLYEAQNEIKYAKKTKIDEKAEHVTEITKESEGGGAEGDEGGGDEYEETPPLSLRLRLYQSEEQRQRLASLIAPPPPSEE